MRARVPLEVDRATREAWLERVAAVLQDHIDGLPSAPARGDLDPAGVRARPIPDEPLSLEEAIGVLSEAVPRSVSTSGPGYLAYVPGGGLYAAGLGEWYASVVNRFTGLAGMAPALVRLENDVLDWLCASVGYGGQARGVLTSGGSLSNFAAVVTAREARLGDDVDLRAATLYTSEEVHHCVPKSARLAGIPGGNVRAIPGDARRRMRPDLLLARVRADRAAGLHPFLVVATAGSTNTGAIDPLQELAELCAREGLWLHVDGAYGGTFVLTERGRRRLAGLERADSITLDPHKGLFLPYGTGCLLVREGHLLAHAHRSSAAYLQDVADVGPSPTHLGPELSRPYRGLSLWLPLVLHGVGAFREALDEKLDLAELAGRELSAMPGVETLPVSLTVVPFRLARRPGEELEAWNARNAAWMEGVNARGRVILSSTMLDGVFTLRICVLSFRTHADRVRAALDDLEAVARAG
ncbi:MAG: aspartate aminotransferase family protein [Planctomycetota bacterium]